MSDFDPNDEFDLPVTDYTIIVPDNETPSLDAYRRLARLAVGGVAEAGDELFRRMQAWEEAQENGGEEAQGREDETTVDLLRYALVGLLLDTPERAARGISTTARITGRMGRLGGTIVGPVARSRPFGPIRRRAEGLMNRAASQVEQWVTTGRVEERSGRELVRYLFNDSVDSVVGMLSENTAVEGLIDLQVQRILNELPEDEAVQALIRQHADSYIDYINSNPERVQALIRLEAGQYLDHLRANPEQVQSLIREQADDYIEYLQVENPGPVQDLVAGQSIGLAGEVVDEVRERTVTADSFIEALVRSILGRAPREELPLPPQPVRERAVVRPLRDRNTRVEEA